MPYICAGMESLQASLGRITPIVPGRVSALPADEINTDNPVETQVHKEARNPDDEGKD